MSDSPLPFGMDRCLLRLDGQDPYFCPRLSAIIVYPPIQTLSDDNASGMRLCR